MDINTFKRVEKKYVLDKNTHDTLLKKIGDRIILDDYSPETICNIYFDTPNYDLIRISTDSPIYKEKIRLRSYGIPTLKDKVYLEIKKKFDGVVSKRRISMTLKDAYDYIYHHKNIQLENGDNSKQIEEEIRFCFDKYSIIPAVYIAYDRDAYYGREDNNFRITFDYNIRSRQNDLLLEKGSDGEYMTKTDKYIMEVKSLDAFPLWFTNILSSLKIYPTSFSKYGEIYKLNKLYKYVY